MKAPSAVLVFVAALLILLTSMWPLGVDGHTIHGKPGLVLPVLHVSDALHACRVHPGARKTAVVAVSSSNA